MHTAKCDYRHGSGDDPLFISACDQLFTNPPFNADGKLTSTELDYFLADMKEATDISQKVDSCIKTEAVRRAEIAGDPQTIDPQTLPLPEKLLLLILAAAGAVNPITSVASGSKRL